MTSARKTTTNHIAHFLVPAPLLATGHRTTTSARRTLKFYEKAMFRFRAALCPGSGQGQSIFRALLRTAGAGSCVQYSAGRWRAPEKQTDTICRRWRPRNNRNKNSSKSRTEMSAASTAIAFNLANWRVSRGRRKPNSTLPISRASIRAPAAAGYQARTNHLPMPLVSCSPR